MWFSFDETRMGGGCSTVGRAGLLVIRRSLVRIPAPRGRTELHAEVSLSKTLNPKVSPDVQLAPCVEATAISCYQRWAGDSSRLNPGLAHWVTGFGNHQVSPAKKAATSRNPHGLAERERSLPNFELHVTSHVYAYLNIHGRILNIIHKYWRVLLDRNLLSPYFNFWTFFQHISAVFFMNWCRASVHEKKLRHTWVSNLSCKNGRSTSSTHFELSLNQFVKRLYLFFCCCFFFFLTKTD